MINKLTLILFFLVLGMQVQAQDFQDLTAIQCDSLIQANVDNPDFIILDVRTPAEYNPEHLEGAIQRNYYDADFIDQLDELPKHKSYLIHCRSGARSGNTFDIMASLGFEAVYNMLGGINAWNGEGLPVTANFAPNFMAISDSIYDLENIIIGETDTINITVTNRGNAALTFETVTDLTGTEFYTDFDQDTVLNGAKDYSFNIFYTPQDEVQDDLVYTIESNASTLVFDIARVGDYNISAANEQVAQAEIRLFPMPVSDVLYVEMKLDVRKIELLDVQGNLLIEHSMSVKQISVSTLVGGTYLLRLYTKDKVYVKRLVVAH